ncbi:hypothetical protein DFH09DRAFT_1339216 [Mycena vulgaris]|nr:hypothetical protein DFH09DRAFT_1339216 [Mycena vulgaris]
MQAEARTTENSSQSGHPRCIHDALPPLHVGIIDARTRHHTAPFFNCVPLLSTLCVKDDDLPRPPPSPSRPPPTAFPRPADDACDDDHPHAAPLQREVARQIRSTLRSQLKRSHPTKQRPRCDVCDDDDHDAKPRSTGNAAPVAAESTGRASGSGAREAVFMPRQIPRLDPGYLNVAPSTSMPHIRTRPPIRGRNLLHHARFPSIPRLKSRPLALLDFREVETRTIPRVEAQRARCTRVAAGVSFWRAAAGERARLRRRGCTPPPAQVSLFAASPPSRAVQACGCAESSFTQAEWRYAAPRRAEIASDAQPLRVEATARRFQFARVHAALLLLAHVRAETTAAIRVQCATRASSTTEREGRREKARARVRAEVS